MIIFNIRRILHYPFLPCFSNPIYGNLLLQILCTYGIKIIFISRHSLNCTNQQLFFNICHRTQFIKRNITIRISLTFWHFIRYIIRTKYRYTQSRSLIRWTQFIPKHICHINSNPIIGKFNRLTSQWIPLNIITMSLYIIIQKIIHRILHSKQQINNPLTNFSLTP